MKAFFLLLLISISSFSFSQDFSALDKYQPEKEFENILVKKVAEDSLQSSFIIWVKKGVKAHYHAEHTENIIVLEGQAVMTMGMNYSLLKWEIT